MTAPKVNPGPVAPRWVDFDDTTRLSRHGACSQLPLRESVIFSATTGPPARRALSICHGCLVTDSCERMLRPQRTKYDGVAAGRLWVNGRDCTDTLTEEDGKK